MGDFIFSGFKPSITSDPPPEIKVIDLEKATKKLKKLNEEAEKKEEKKEEELTTVEPSLLTKYYESAKKLDELSKGRLLSNIPLSDEYYAQLKIHRELFNQLEEAKKY